LVIVLKPEFGKIVSKAWRDPAFKAELIANSAAALKAEGIDVPAGRAVTVVENTDKHFYLVVPPVASHELAENALWAVARSLILHDGRKIGAMTETNEDTAAAEAQQEPTQGAGAKAESASTAKASGELSEDDLEAVAGGKNMTRRGGET
jgi:Nitrile hydratase, alpha chain